MCIYIHFVVTTVFFNNSLYNVNEDNGQVEVTLILSKPSSTDITVTITDIQGTASGELSNIRTYVERSSRIRYYVSAW